MSSNVGTTLRLDVFSPCPMDTFMSLGSKWNSNMSALFTFDLSFSFLHQILNMLWSHCFLFWDFFRKSKKPIGVLILTVTHFVLRAFEIRNTTIVTTAAAFSFFQVFSLLCMKLLVFINLPPFLRFYKSFSKMQKSVNKEQITITSFIWFENIC